MMYALVLKNSDGKISISQTCNDSELYALKRIVPDYRRSWPNAHWSIHPFLKVIDQSQSSGANPYPIREGFDPTVGGIPVE